MHKAPSVTEGSAGGTAGPGAAAQRRKGMGKEEEDRAGGSPAGKGRWGIVSPCSPGQKPCHAGGKRCPPLSALCSPAPSVAEVPPRQGGPSQYRCHRLGRGAALKTPQQLQPPMGGKCRVPAGPCSVSAPAACPAPQHSLHLQDRLPRSYLIPLLPRAERCPKALLLPASPTGCHVAAPPRTSRAPTQVSGPARSRRCPRAAPCLLARPEVSAGQSHGNLGWCPGESGVLLVQLHLGRRIASTRHPQPLPGIPKRLPEHLLSVPQRAEGSCADPSVSCSAAPRSRSG